MNQTEHQLRMAFDPEYEKNWELLAEYRKAKRRECVDIFRGVCSIMAFAISTTLSITLYLPLSSKLLLALAIMSFLSLSAIITYCQFVKLVKEARRILEL
jgi:hypothetical protein